MQLIAEKVVTLTDFEGCSEFAVRQIFKKNELKPWQKKEWKIPPKANEEFVWRMEAVLEIYKREWDAEYPLLCFDESSKQQIQEVMNSLPMKPGQPVR